MNIININLSNETFCASFLCNGLYYWVKGVIVKDAVTVKSHTCDFFIDNRDVKNQIKELLYEKYSRKVI